MTKVRWPLIAVLGVVGFVWLGQGIGLIGGSFMSGELFWAVAGGVMILAAIVLATSARNDA